jgi:hypothetical protein
MGAAEAHEISLEKQAGTFDSSWEEGTTQQRPSTLYSYIEIPTRSTIKFTLTSTTANDYNMRLNFCGNLSPSQEDYKYRKYLRNTFNKDV